MFTTIVRNGDLVQILEAAVTTDRYNSEVLDWDNASIVATGRASVQHYLTSEDDEDRQTETEGLRLISDDPALYRVIQPTHRIIYDGETFDVSAPDQNWRLFNKAHHVEVYLKRVVG